MSSPTPAHTDMLDDLRAVLESPLLDIARALSEMLAPTVAHSALVIFTEDCTGRPRKRAGAAEIIDHVTIAELDAIRADRALDRSNAPHDENGSPGAATTVVVAGRERDALVWVADTGSLLVVTDPVLGPHTDAGRLHSEVARVWEIVALSIRQQVAAAAPTYLIDSRAASRERSRIVAELSDEHATTLEALLGVLRSPRSTDDAARSTAANIAASAMVRLRSVTDRERSIAEEPVAKAFARLKDDLLPLVRFGGFDMEYVDPPVHGRPVPGEVAHAGRAIVRGAVLALVEQHGVGRVRVQWDCDGHNLLVNIRDDGPGDLTIESASVRPLAARVAALDGEFRVEATPGWGSDIAVRMPLDAPAAPPASATEWALSSREAQVLELVAAGERNRAIARDLSISENTVKFHVANLLRKAGAANRVELAALVRG
ncbi:LuxR C-terminal-related transcriptional regulator [Marisediminicola sp. LYQ85]|uniref:helix-turn-helix transcriptional regulator n=1 Tax=Marisediminicola sp. LYQ85 TaxID=3391062 RepID=UPI0039836158